ncbi:hypothetical protein KQX54_018356 [Cotesia glomerata]|uniref:Uncharacterized protein n=1 Tax=Cotesia glomerata TaxID=32391 RepID=A0AAV7IG07_COTGL|nr:hypothetical protein KQX54_018356 [Cotesia glomerata]
MYCVQLLVSPRAFLRDENNPSFIASRIDVISGCSLHGKSVCQYEDDHTQYEKLLPKLELVHFITQVEDENEDRNFVDDGLNSTNSEIGLENRRRTLTPDTWAKEKNKSKYKAKAEAEADVRHTFTRTTKGVRDVSISPSYSISQHRNRIDLTSTGILSFPLGNLALLFMLRHLDYFPFSLGGITAPSTGYSHYPGYYASTYFHNNSLEPIVRRVYLAAQLPIKSTYSHVLGISTNRRSTSRIDLQRRVFRERLSSRVLIHLLVLLGIQSAEAKGCGEPRNAHRFDSPVRSRKKIKFRPLAGRINSVQQEECRRTLTRFPSLLLRHTCYSH